MSRNKLIAATAVAILFTGLAVTDGFARGGGGGAGGHGGGSGGGGGGFASGGAAHIGGNFGGLGGGNLGCGLGATRPQGGNNGAGMARGPERTFGGPVDSNRYRTARGEPDHYGDRFDDRDHDPFRNLFCSRPTRTTVICAITALRRPTGPATTTAALRLTKDGPVTTRIVSAIDVELLLAADPIPLGPAAAFSQSSAIFRTARRQAGGASRELASIVFQEILKATLAN